MAKEQSLISKVETNNGRNIVGELEIENTLTSDRSINEAGNYAEGQSLKKPEETSLLNSKTSQMLSSVSELPGKLLKIPAGNPEGLKRVINFQESVHVDIST
uniref:Uncharacterized protein n=1 Tax=Setaria digitata TaxID=48799 RepID=A0A915PJ61_9BILA